MLKNTMQIRNNYLGMGVCFFYKMKIKNTTLLEQLKKNRNRGKIDTPNTFSRTNRLI